MKRTYVGVRDLAEFSADPKSFIKNKGKVRNKAAAKHGLKMHDSIGKKTYSRFGFSRIIIKLLIAVCFIGGFYFFRGSL